MRWLISLFILFVWHPAETRFERKVMVAPSKPMMAHTITPAITAAVGLRVVFAASTSRSPTIAPARPEAIKTLLLPRAIFVGPASSRARFVCLLPCDPASIPNDIRTAPRRPRLRHGQLRCTTFQAREHRKQAREAAPGHHGDDEKSTFAQSPDVTITQQPMFPCAPGCNLLVSFANISLVNSEVKKNSLQAMLHYSQPRSNVETSSNLLKFDMTSTLDDPSMATLLLVPQQPQPLNEGF